MRLHFSQGPPCEKPYVPSSEKTRNTHVRRHTCWRISGQKKKSVPTAFAIRSACASFRALRMASRCSLHCWTFWRSSLRRRRSWRWRSFASLRSSLSRSFCRAVISHSRSERDSFRTSDHATGGGISESLSDTSARNSWRLPASFQHPCSVASCALDHGVFFRTIGFLSRYSCSTDNLALAAGSSSFQRRSFWWFGSGSPKASKAITWSSSWQNALRHSFPRHATMHSRPDVNPL